MKKGKLEIIGTVITLAGFILGFVGDYVDEKALDQTIEEKVKAAIAEHKKNK